MSSRRGFLVLQTARSHFVPRASVRLAPRLLLKRPFAAFAPRGRPQGALVGNHRTLAAEAHGGDDVYSVERLICDFSVTTNALGPVKRAAEVTREKFVVEDSFTTARGGDIKAILEDESEHVVSAPAIQHYPKRTDNDLGRLILGFLRLHEVDTPEAVQLERLASERLLLGCGASELIDLLARAAPPGAFCSTPLFVTQYREYTRACKSTGRASAESAKDASIVCFVNPSNPTGQFIQRTELEEFIAENVAPGSWVVVDESMLFWSGPDWYRRGISEAFVQRMLRSHIKVFRVHSWTKIFACTGLRIGSVVCPCPETRHALASLQVPWTVTTLARTYLREALTDAAYLQRTWKYTTKWRSSMQHRLQRIYPSWKILGEEWLPFLWIDTGDADLAKAVYETSLQCGCPVRYGKHGYDLPTFLRIAVRRPSDFGPLHQALLRHESSKGEAGHFGTFADVEPSVIDGVQLVHIDDLKPHENVLTDRASRLEEYLGTLPVKHLPAIIVCGKTQVVIDGHHRLSLFKATGMNIVPAVFVNYAHEDILVNPPGSGNPTTKEMVIGSAAKGEMLPPKSTQHMVRTRSGQLMPIIVLAPQIVELRY